MFSGPFQYDDAHNLALRTMGLVLQSRLLDTIRQELGETYSITVNPSTSRYPRPEFMVRIDWTCDPARAKTLVQRVLQEVEFVKNTKLSTTQIGLIHEALLREFERSSQSNGYVLNQVTRRYEDGDTTDLTSIDHLPEQIAALTGAQVQEAAQTYLNSANYVVVTLMPEK